MGGLGITSLTKERMWAGRKEGRGICICKFQTEGTQVKTASDTTQIQRSNALIMTKVLVRKYLLSLHYITTTTHRIFSPDDYTINFFFCLTKYYNILSQYQLQTSSQLRMGPQLMRLPAMLVNRARQFDSMCLMLCRRKTNYNSAI